MGELAKDKYQQIPTRGKEGTAEAGDGKKRLRLGKMEFPEKRERGRKDGRKCPERLRIGSSLLPLSSYLLIHL